MYAQYSSMRKILLNDGRVTNYVSASNIQVGYSTEHDSYPCITIFRGGGSGIGKLGYQTSDAGSKDVSLSSIFQIDIFHEDSVEDVENIDDVVRKALMSGSSTGVGLTLSSNPSYWDETFQAYRVTQTWVRNEIMSD